MSEKVRVCASDALQPNTTKRRVWFTSWDSLIAFARSPLSSAALIARGYRIVMCSGDGRGAFWTAEHGWLIFD